MKRRSSYDSGRTGGCFKRALSGAAFAAISAAAALIFFELLLRATNLFPPPVVRPSKIEGLVFETRPGVTYRTYGSVAEINSAGFRDYEFEVEKKEGVRRVVCLGDSMTMAVALPPGAAYMKALEEKFRGKAEFFNMGVGGYNTAQEWLVYEHKATKYSPDLVLVQFLLNDLAYSYPLLIGNDMGSRLKRFCGERVGVYRFLSFAARKLRGDFDVDQSKLIRELTADGPVTMNFMRKIYKPEGRFFREWKAAAGKFGELNRSGMPVLFVIFPWPVYRGVDRGTPYPYYEIHDQVKEVLNREGLPNIDVTGALSRRDSMMEFWVTPADFHLNAEAHRIIAGELTPYFEKFLGDSPRK